MQPRDDEICSASCDGREFRIVADPNVGFYLYVFENGRCIRDYLQDSEAIAKEMAEDDFGVPASVWHAKNK
jgi:hypothetical protein